MYKIILAYFLVAAAVAEGLLFDEKYYKQGKYGDIVKEYNNRMSKSENIIKKDIRELNKVLSEIPSRTCQYEVEEPIKFEKHCFYPNAILCESVMTECVYQAYYEMYRFLFDVFETHINLRRFNRDLKQELAHCESSFDASITKKDECVTDVYSRGYEFLKRNQLQYNNQMDIADQKQRDMNKKLRNSLMLLKSNQTSAS